MSLREETKAKGTLTLTLRNKHGQIKENRVENLVLNVGLASIAKRMINDAEAKVSHMALGTDGTPAAGTDTQLGAEIGRVAMQSTTSVTETVTDDAVQHVAEFGAGVATGTLREAGLLTAVAAGKLWCRSVFAPLGKEADDVLTIAWVIKIGV